MNNRNGIYVWFNPLTRANRGDLKWQIVRRVNSRNDPGAFKTIFPSRTFTYDEAKSFASQCGFRHGLEF